MGKEDKKMKNETRNDEAVSPVIATILMVAITVVLAGAIRMGCKPSRKQHRRQPRPVRL